MNRVMVAGIGNIFASDDGFGPEVLRRMQSGTTMPEGVRMADFGIRGVHLAYELLDGWDALVLVDAIPDRGAPGRIRVFEPDTESLAGAGFDAHSMDPATVLGSVRALGGTMPRTVIVGCEVVTVEDGMGLSAPVAAAVDEAVAAVTDVVAMLTATLSESEV